MRIGIDIGSTTIKCVVLDDEANVLYSNYQRHYSHIKENLLKILYKLKDENLITKDEIGRASCRERV